jgi:hypothetical protein
MTEMPRIAGEQIFASALNSGHQDWLVLGIQRNALWEGQALRRIGRG